MATHRRHWFKLDDAVEREPLGNNELALLVRLTAHFNARRSRDVLDPDAACRAVLRPAVLANLAGCQSLARARRILNGLAVHFESIRNGGGVDEQFTWSPLDVNSMVEWRNLAISQGWASEPRADRGHEAARQVPPPTPTPAPTPKTQRRMGRQPEPDRRRHPLNLDPALGPNGIATRPAQPMQPEPGAGRESTLAAIRAASSALAHRKAPAAESAAAVEKP